MKRDRNGLPVDVDYWRANDVERAYDIAHKAKDAFHAIQMARKISQFKASPCVLDSRVRAYR
jgi:hypothetical protein